MVALYHAIMWAGSFWCHQMPERSPHIFGVQLPLCWRCTGIAIGTLILVLSLLKRKRLPSLSNSLPFAALMPLDVLSAMFGFWPGHNALRFVTGILWGVFGTVVVLRVGVLVAESLRRSTRRDTVKARPAQVDISYYLSGRRRLKLSDPSNTRERTGSADTLSAERL